MRGKTATAHSNVSSSIIFSINAWALNEDREKKIGANEILLFRKGVEALGRFSSKITRPNQRSDISTTDDFYWACVKPTPFNCSLQSELLKESIARAIQALDYWF